MSLTKFLSAFVLSLMLMGAVVAIPHVSLDQAYAYGGGGGDDSEGEMGDMGDDGGDADGGDAGDGGDADDCSGE